jgi:hypothetical protein
VLERPRANEKIELDMGFEVRYVWKVRAKTPMSAIKCGFGKRNKFEDNLA